MTHSLGFIFPSKIPNMKESDLSGAAAAFLKLTLTELFFAKIFECRKIVAIFSRQFIFDRLKKISANLESKFLGLCHFVNI